jgi:hypothetical protein
VVGVCLFQAQSQAPTPVSSGFSSRAQPQAMGKLTDPEQLRPPPQALDTLRASSASVLVSTRVLGTEGPDAHC